MSAFLRIRAANVFNVLKNSANLQWGSASKNAVENNHFRNVSTKVMLFNFQINILFKKYS